MPRLGSGFSVAVAQKYTKEDQEQCGGVKSKKWVGSEASLLYKLSAEFSNSVGGVIKRVVLF